MCREKTPWEKAVEFHGHACPGLAIGFRAAEEALRRLGVTRSGDEEVQRLREMPAEELFTVQEVRLNLPEQAKVFPTVTCAVCGEGVMEPRARVREGKIVCPACAEEYRVPLFRI